MRVLLTNCALRERSGTEVVILDLALGLVRRGHEVAVFTQMVGDSAGILRDRGILVTDRPEELRTTPNVIHGHHNHVLAAALASFPGVPARRQMRRAWMNAEVSGNFAKREPGLPHCSQLHHLRGI